MGRTGFLWLACAGVIATPALAGDLADAADMAEALLPEIVVTAIVPADTRLIAGAHDVVERADIRARAPLSLRDQLIAIPGLAVIEEDAGGLALNIGMRGLDPRRSARTLLMEDGVPLFLAPYADPAAHYAPPVERVERIEVVRGSGQILHGPQTVGGMINFVTTPVPTAGLLLRAEARAGTTDFLGLQGAVGTGNDRAGVLLEATTRSGDGIRTGHEFALWELVGKARVMIGEVHELKLRASHYRERSHISEVMLGTLEWADDPLQAPTAGQDRFRQNRTQLQASHVWTPSDAVRLITTGYWVHTTRASFRQTNTPGAWGDEPDERGVATGWSVLDRCFDEDDPAPGTGGSQANRITPAAAAACGGRWRPRKFHYYGVEPRLEASHTLFGAAHQTTLGARWHQERVQRDQFRSPDPAIQDLDFALGLTGSAHREDAAIRVRAWSAFVQDSMTLGNVTITGGLRLEDVRTVTAIRRASSQAVNITVAQHDTALLPGLGAVWRLAPGTELFAGVHSGFAPPRPSRDIGTAGPAVVAPERSTNFEIGVRSQPANGISLSATLFRTDFRQIVIASAAGRFINGGRSRQQGLEFSGRIDSAPLTGSDHNIWLQTAWTWLPTAKFLTTSDAAFNIGDGGIVGAPCDDGDDCVNGNGIIAGSRLAYAARHAVSATLGYRHPAGVEARVGLDYRSAQQPDPFARVLDTAINAAGCSDAACSGLAGDIPAVTLINAGLSFTPQGSRVTLFATGWNLADKRYLATRVDGMGAGRPRTIVAGVRFAY